MTKIKFKDYDHSYKNGKRKYNSVSNVVGRYKNPYDADYWSSYKAYERLIDNEKDFKSLRLKAGYPRKDPKLFTFLDLYVDREKIPAIKKQILKEWKAKNTTGVNKGNMYHEYMENKAITEGTVVNNYNNRTYPTITSVTVSRDNKGELRTPVYSSLKELEDGFHPELILWNDLAMIAGQADRVFIETIDGVRYADIDDYKTNVEIKTTNIWDKMLEPINHLDDCNYIHYCLQISLYAWILEQEDYVIRDLRFTHINKPYPTRYMKYEVENMLFPNGEHYMNLL